MRAVQAAFLFFRTRISRGRPGTRGSSKRVRLLIGKAESRKPDLLQGVRRGLRNRHACARSPERAGAIELATKGTINVAIRISSITRSFIGHPIQVFHAAVLLQAGSPRVTYGIQEFPRESQPQADGLGADWIGKCFSETAHWFSCARKMQPAPAPKSLRRRSARSK